MTNHKIIESINIILFPLFDDHHRHDTDEIMIFYKKNLKILSFVTINKNILFCDHMLECKQQPHLGKNQIGNKQSFWE